MCAGYSDRIIVIVHNLSEKLGSGKHWNTGCFCCGKLRIAFVDSSSVNYQVDTGGDIVCALAIYDFYALGRKSFCEV